MSKYLQLIEILQIISIDNKPIIENGSSLQMFKLQFGHQWAKFKFMTFPKFVIPNFDENNMFQL